MFRTTIQFSQKQYTNILHITDTEGSDALFKSINKSNIVGYHPKEGLYFKKQKNMTPFFIFGGDATDRGKFDLRLTQLLVDFKNKHPFNVALIVGNREITKNRFKNELTPAIKNRLLKTEQARWLTEKTLPLDYVSYKMTTTNLHKNYSAHDYIQSLSTEESQLLYLRWMLEKTMGCPHAFRYRKIELAELIQKTFISDHDVLQSFLQSTAPDGITGQYLQLAQVGVIVPNTQVLAVHGGLTPFNIGRTPDMHTTAERISNANVCIRPMNPWYKKQIQAWIHNQPDSLQPASTDLDTAALPFPDKPKTVITADHLGKNREFISIPPPVSDYLSQNNIHLVLTGHQPIGDHPAITRDDDNAVLFINGDTGYANLDAKSQDDTRGNAQHTLEIAGSLINTEVCIQATLFDASEVKTFLNINDDGITGNKYIGRILPNGYLVQCLLPDNTYRLARQNHFKISYKNISVDEIEDILYQKQNSQVGLRN